MVYFYEAGNMSIKGIVNLKDFNLVEKTKYAEFRFSLFVYSVVCAIK